MIPVHWPVQERQVYSTVRNERHDAAGETTGTALIVKASSLVPLLAAPLIAGSLLLATSGAEARLYRWVDENGEVHFSDQVPPEHSRSARSELNARGREIERTERAKTLEEIEQEKELERLRKEQERLIAEQKARDSVLLRTFRSEEDMLMARDGKLAAIDTNIMVTRSNIRRSKQRLDDMQSRAAKLERQGQPPSENLLKDIEQTRQQLKQNYASIIEREQEKEKIRTSFAADMARFRNLKKLSANQEPEPLEAPRAASILDTVVLCSGEQDCNLAWVLAEKYARTHATTRLQMLSDSIVMTAAPERDKDISITISRIPRKDAPGAELFMDLQCRETPSGKEYCQSEAVEKIRNGFRQQLSSR